MNSHDFDVVINVILKHYGIAFIKTMFQPLLKSSVASNGYGKGMLEAGKTKKFHYTRRRPILIGSGSSLRI